MSFQRQYHIGLSPFFFTIVREVARGAADEHPSDFRWPEFLIEWKAVLHELGFTKHNTVPYQLRHSGPTFDCSMKRRSVAEAQTAKSLVIHHLEDAVRLLEVDRGAGPPLSTHW